MEGIMHITIRNAAVGGLLALALTMTLVAPVQAYEVWVTDQSDTGKESGGYLYIYDGASLAANPASAKPATTIDLAGDINKFCEEVNPKARAAATHAVLYERPVSPHTFLSEWTCAFHGRNHPQAGSLLIHGQECSRRVAHTRSEDGDRGQHRGKEIH